MKPDDLFQSILHQFFIPEQMDLVTNYLTQHDNSKKIETQKALRQLVPQDLLNQLRIQIVKFKHGSDRELAVLSVMIANLCRDKKQVVDFLRCELSRQVKKDMMYFVCFCNVVTSYNLFFLNWRDLFWNIGITIAKGAVYFFIMQCFLDELLHKKIVTDYLKQMISPYLEKFSSIPARQLLCRIDDLLRDDYKELFVELNNSRTPNRNPEIPSFKNLAAFFVQHNTDTDISNAPIPQELKNFTTGM